MNPSQFITAVALSISSLIFISCSGTSDLATQKEGGAASVYPEWYNASQAFVPDTAGTFHGYATALAGDSSVAAQKAITHAEEELKSGISRRLESVRKKAADELGNSSGLNTAGFIITLRKAETNVKNASDKANVTISSNENYKGYRSFAEAAVNEEALMRELDKAMRRYRTAWNAMKTSQAFSKF